MGHSFWSTAILKPFLQCLWGSWWLSPFAILWCREALKPCRWTVRQSLCNELNWVHIVPTTLSCCTCVSGLFIWLSFSQKPPPSGLTKQKLILEGPSSPPWQSGYTRFLLTICPSSSDNNSSALQQQLWICSRDPLTGHAGHAGGFARP